QGRSINTASATVGKTCRLCVRTATPRGNPLPGTVPRARRTGRVRWQTPLRRCALPLAELEAVAERVGDMAAADAGERRVALRPDAGGGQARLQGGEVVDDEARVRLAGSLRVFLCIGGWLGVVRDAVSEVDAQDGHRLRPVV